MIQAEQSAAFVYQMEQVLDVYEQPYNVQYPVVCLDESPKQLLDYEQFIAPGGQRYRDSEYVRRDVVELASYCGHPPRKSTNTSRQRPPTPADLEK